MPFCKHSTLTCSNYRSWPSKLDMPTQFGDLQGAGHTATLCLDATRLGVNIHDTATELGVNIHDTAASFPHFCRSWPCLHCIKEILTIIFIIKLFLNPIKPSSKEGIQSIEPVSFDQLCTPAVVHRSALRSCTHARLHRDGMTVTMTQLLGAGNVQPQSPSCSPKRSALGQHLLVPRYKNNSRQFGYHQVDM